MTQTLIDEAYRFASEKHEGQVRKYSGESYIVHPTAVAAMVKDKGGSDEMVAAALLHDTVEDTDATHSDIERLFGANVGQLVFELTDQYTKAAHPSMNRMTRKGLEACRMVTVSDAAKLIKLCDIADNISTIVHHDPSFAKTYLKEKAHLLDMMGY